MKKILLIVLASVILCTVFSGCNSSKADAKKVGVVQIMDHESLNIIRDSFKAEMEKLGYTDDNSEIIYQSANGDAATLPTIINNFKNDNVDVIVAITTPAAEAAANVSDEIPVVFSAVTNPIDAKLVKSLEAPGGNITGTSDALSIGKILDFARSITDIKTLGYIYNASETNSVSCLEEVKAYCKEQGIDVVEQSAATASDIQIAAKDLCSKVDAIFTPNDNTIASSMTVLSDIATDAKIPVYVGADTMVKAGGLGTVGIEYTSLGQETAKMTDRILKGEKAGDIPVKVFNDDLYTYINMTIADKLGVKLPPITERTVTFN